MKKLLLLVVATLSMVSVSAQMDTWYVGTSGISTVADGYGPFSGVSITFPQSGSRVGKIGLAPEIGYFVDDNVSIGLGMYGSYKKSGPIKDREFGINPYVRYYFLTVGDFKMYGQANAQYASYKEVGFDSQSIWGLNLVPGIAYNLSDRFAINATFGKFGYESIKDGNSTLIGTLDASSLKFGFSVALY